MFLATNDKIRTMLKTSLAQIEGYEELLADVVNTSVHMFENKLYLLPSEKHMLVKVIGFSLFLIDSTACNINKLDGKKKINVSRIDKIFKVKNLPQIESFNDDFRRSKSFHCMVICKLLRLIISRNHRISIRVNGLFVMTLRRHPCKEISSCNYQKFAKNTKDLLPI